jgi:hypothetical protein
MMLGRKSTGRGASNGALYAGVRPLPGVEDLRPTLKSRPARRSVVVVVSQATGGRAETRRREFDADAIVSSHVAAWRWLADNSVGREWAVVIGDDALPRGNSFRYVLDFALDTSPAPIAQLHACPEHLAPTSTDEREWIIASRICGDIAVAVMTDVLGDLILHVRSQRSMERSVNAWLAHRGRTAACARLGLVDHRPGKASTPMTQTTQRACALRVGAA